MHKSDIRQYFDARAAKWDEICHHDPHKLAAIAALADIRPGMRVVDIACGTGAMFGTLLNCGVSEVLGVDLSGAMIDKARTKHADNRIRLLAADILEVYETGFDAAMLYSAYPHFPDKRALVRHIADMLAPGGRITIAHSQGRATINARHADPQTAQVSVTLRPAAQEATELAPYFTVDTIVDTPQLYVLSGIKQSQAIPLRQGCLYPC